MSKVKIKLFGREHILNVIFDCYRGEEILPVQEEALKCFCEKCDTDSSLKYVKKYCEKNSNDNITEPIENVFKYIKPTDLYIVRNKKKHEVAIMCKFKFDIEHGLVIVFVNEKFSKIGQQDIVL